MVNFVQPYLFSDVLLLLQYYSDTQLSLERGGGGGAKFEYENAASADWCVAKVFFLLNSLFW